MTKLTRALLLIALSYFLVSHQGSARILTECEAAKELARSGIERSFISTYVCIMKSESGMNTKKVTGPGPRSSKSFGIFQISSEANKYCSQFGPAGICKKNCHDFSNDDLKDDIACAKKIADREGFQHWKGWVKSCKNGKLPNVSGCLVSTRKIRQSSFYWAAEEADQPEDVQGFQIF